MTNGFYEDVPFEDYKKAHEASDTDQSAKSIHHTLGPGANQAAPGTSAHDLGDLKWTASPKIRPNWLDCWGQAISRAIYKDLFDEIGTIYGAGDGSTTFNLPDGRGRFPVGYDPDTSSYDSLGKVGGSISRTLTAANIPPLTAGFSTDVASSNPNEPAFIRRGLSGSSATRPISGLNSGATSFDIRPPFRTFRLLIRVT